MATANYGPTALHLRMVAGADFSAGITVTESGSAYNPTGATITTGILNAAGATVATNLTSGFASNLLTISLTATQTTTLGAGMYRYYVNVTKSSVVRPWLAGVIAVHPFGSPTSDSGRSVNLAITTPTITLAL